MRDKNINILFVVFTFVATSKIAMGRRPNRCFIVILERGSPPKVTRENYAKPKNKWSANKETILKFLYLGLTRCLTFLVRIHIQNEKSGLCSSFKNIII